MEFDVHRKTGDIAAEALGTDAGGIDLLQDFRFKLRVARIGIRGAEGPLTPSFQTSPFLVLISNTPVSEVAASSPT